MRDWQLTIETHWPHDRCAIGWEYVAPNEDFEYTTIKLYLILITLTLDY